MRPDDETVTARTARSGLVTHVPDVFADPTYQNKDVARGIYRACLGVPMVRDGQVFGVIFVARARPGYFADAQVELLKTFAEQALIAIENARLLHELEARNRDLTVALQRQTATAEILRVISSSPRRFGRSSTRSPLWPPPSARPTPLACSASTGISSPSRPTTAGGPTRSPPLRAPSRSGRAAAA
jgi:transcriptional regulator with GAF, ATPase, and Fis domain